jgi:hypothetical protein
MYNSLLKESTVSKKLNKKYDLYINQNNIKFPLINSNEMIKYFNNNSELMPNNKDDINNIISRQILSNNSPNNVIGITKSKCKYNYPQAFINSIITPKSISTGFIRLSCPHLVKEIDLIENDLIIKFNNLLKENNELKENYYEINEYYKKIKHELLNNTIIKKLILFYLNDCIDSYNNFMNSGILGVSNINDVKCLHAHVADHLLRGNNKIGEMTLNTLKNNGVDINGCDNCHQQCNAKHKINDSSWFYVPSKNKLGLRLSKVNKYNHNQRNKV